MQVLKWLDEHFEEAMLNILLMGLAGVMMLQIIMRFVFNSALSWGEELSQECFVLTTFISIGYCTRTKSALRVDLFSKMLPGKVYAALEVFIEVVSMIAYGYFFYGAVSSTAHFYRSGQLVIAMRHPTWWLYVGVTLGFFCAVARSVQVVVKRILYLIRRNPS